MTNENKEKEVEEIADKDQVPVPTIGEELPEEHNKQKPKQIMMTDVEVRNLKKETMEYKDKYLRLLADADNTRKRLQKEREEMIQYAIENIMVDLLRPLDNFEHALKFADQMSDEVKNWAFGFQMILNQFKDVLTNNGVAPIPSQQGQAFNPHDQEAIEMIETDQCQPGMIIEECVRGYKIGDRIIRPARVKVAKGKSNSKEESNSEQNNHLS
jgi:molecular chaperone GrpE